jgi:hypothetical protein
MTGTLVLMPWQDTGDTHREAAMNYTLRHWTRDHQLPVMVCRLSPTKPWCKADALATGMRIDAPTVVIVADADCLVDVQAVTDCIRAVRDGRPWAIPHWSVLRLTRGVSEMVMRGGSVTHPAVLQGVEQPPYLGVACGGVVVLQSDVALSVPMDGNYEDWGGEDYSWGLALDTLVGGPYRPDAHTPLVHLWHPRHPRAGHGTNLSSDEPRRIAYFEAWAERDVTTMRRLVEEGRRWPSATST